MERLIRILICLVNGDSRRGVPIERLLRMADLAEDTEATRAQLRRDLNILRQGGWDIRNVAGDGEDGRYVLRVRDNRLAVLLTPGEIAALRAVWQESEFDHGRPPPFVGRLHHAIRDRSLTAFDYGGERRVVHPDALYSTPSGWVLLARDAENGPAKEYAAAWLDNVEIIGPGTASPLPELPPERLDPLLWRLDPPVQVRLGVVPPFVDDVLTLLPGAEVVGSRIDGSGAEECIVQLEVTNQATFHSRLYSLGLRVRVVEPESLVTDIVENLQAIARSGA